VARIYTRTGDKGETGLVDGTRVPKDSIRVQAYGDIDELNSALGLVRAFLIDDQLDSLIEELQKDLFTVGAELALSEGDSNNKRITSQHILELEKIIDRYQLQLPPLKAFILPGGGKAGAVLHFARAVARRAERKMITLARSEKINDQLIPYINRLSDLLFVLARAANHRENKTEIQWRCTPSSVET
jgi:cob(I)alamin adenosyltransferase